MRPERHSGLQDNNLDTPKNHMALRIAWRDYVACCQGIIDSRFKAARPMK